MSKHPNMSKQHPMPLSEQQHPITCQEETVPLGAAAATAASCKWIFVSAPRLLWDSGMGCSFLASLIFAFSALFVKLTAGRVPVLEVCLIRSSICTALSFILMYLSGMSSKQFFGQRKNMALLFIRGCTGACGTATYYLALFMLPLGDAVTINLIGPPVTAVFARLLLKEPLGYHGLVGCLISLGGVVLVARPPFLFGGHEEWARTRSIGAAAGVISAVLGGCSSMTIRLIGGAEPAAVIAVWFHTATMLLSVVPLAVGVPDRFALLSRVDGTYMLGVAATSFVAQLLSTRGLQRCQAAKAAAMGFTQVVYSNIMGSVFFHDDLSLGGFLGTLLVLAGVLLVTLRTSGDKSAAAKEAAAANPCISMAVLAAGKATHEGYAEDSDAQALLTDSHLQSHLGPAACHACSTGEADADVSVLAVVKLRLMSAAKPKECDSQGNFSPVVGPAAGSNQMLRTATPLGMNSPQAPAAACPEEVQGCLLTQIAASAAAALGGELCPAGSTAVALDLSRQVSRQLGSLAVSQMSRQPSQWLTGSTSVFLNGPGLVWDQTREPQQHSQQQQQQQLQTDCDQDSQQQQQHEQQPVLDSTQLKQALLPDSPTSTSVCKQQGQDAMALQE